MKMIVKKKALCALAAIFLVLIGWTAWGNTALERNTYTISSCELLVDAFVFGNGGWRAV